jgi:outer membrane receptor protein involved in Fe transport
VFNKPWWIAPSSSNLDLRALWQGKEDRYEFIVYAKNVLDSAQYGQGPVAFEAGNSATPGVYSQYTEPYRDPPRTFGVEFHYKFF